MLNVINNLSPKFNKENATNSKNTKKAGFSSNPIKSIAVSESFKKANPFIKNWDKWLGIVTALTSTIGFSVGGAALMSDYLHQLKKGKKATNPENNNTSKAVDEKDPFNQFRTLINKNQDTKTKDASKNHEEGHINPETKFGKLGLTFAKIGVGFSGIAGIFNGIAMRLPLMALGEGVNVAASPIINTPAGFGLMAIGLSGIFAGRALENDPALKLNTAVLASKPLGEKAKYLASNAFLSMKELVKSTKTTFGHLFNLVNPEKSKKAVSFFKDKIIAISSSTLSFNESILADGTRIIKAGVKSHPYRMHTASVILALGGVILTAASALNSKIGQKIGFKTCETGGGLDNIGLSCSGLEKIKMGNKASGSALAVSGMAILAGQAEAESQRGRAMQWMGCGLLFAAFIFERNHDLKKALSGMKEILKTGEAKESSQLIRQWEVDLPDAISRKDLKKHLNNLAQISKGGESAKKAIDAIKADPKVAPVAKLIEFMEGKFAAQGKYKPSTFINPKTQEGSDIAKQLVTDLKKSGIEPKLAESVRFVSEATNEREVAKAAIADNIKMFGENYTPELKKIIKNPTVSENIKIEAKEALKKHN